MSAADSQGSDMGVYCALSQGESTGILGCSEDKAVFISLNKSTTGGLSTGPCALPWAGSSEGPKGPHLFPPEWATLIGAAGLPRMAAGPRTTCFDKSLAEKVGRRV